MFTILIQAVVAAVLTVSLGGTGACGWGWATTWGILLFIAGQATSALLMQKRVKRAMGAVQGILVSGQKRLQAKTAQWQFRPPGSIRQAQAEIEKDQKAFVEKALEASKELERFNNWVPLMKRQIATLRLQLYWMVKDFKHVDELMPQALVVDPLMGAMKLARMQMKGETEGMEKLFKKLTRRLRYGQGALLYNLYAWILVQKKDYDGAFKVLNQAAERMEDPVVKANRDALANNRISAFSNAGLGDAWYALHLETPKIKTQRPSKFSHRPF